MVVMPLHLVRVVGEPTFVFALAFATVCAITMYARAHPARRPAGSALAARLQSLLDEGGPFILLLAAPVQAAGTVDALEKLLRGAVRREDYAHRHGERRLAIVVKTDRAAASRVAARMAASAESDPAFFVGTALSPEDGEDPVALIAAATERLGTAFERGRQIGPPAPPTQRPADAGLPVMNEEGIAREIGRFISMRRRKAVAIFHLSIDQFTKYVEQFGRKAMDDILRDLGTNLRRHVRGGDWAAQTEGGSIVLAITVTPAQARDVSARLLAYIRRPVVAEKGGSLRMTASIGAAFAPGSADSAPELVEAATIAMNVAKGKGGNTAVFFDQSMWTVRGAEVQRDVF